MLEIAYTSIAKLKKLYTYMMIIYYFYPSNVCLFFFSSLGIVSRILIFAFIYLSI